MEKRSIPTAKKKIEIWSLILSILVLLEMFDFFTYFYAEQLPLILLPSSYAWTYT